MTDVAVRESGAAIAEQVIVKGDLAKLTEAERMAYYRAVCESLGLNPLTRPFEYITLNGKLTLYATRGAGDQLRASRGISITGLTASQVGDLHVVVATGRDREGREDSSTGAVSIKGLTGEALANSLMKAETKAKRRLTLSLAGLGWPDETEVESIPGVVHAERPTLAQRVEAKRAEIVVEETETEQPSETVEGELVEAETAADLTAALDDAEAEARFKEAVKRAKVSREEVAAAARKCWGGIPSTAYSAKHWIGLAAELGIEL